MALNTTIFGAAGDNRGDYHLFDVIYGSTGADTLQDTLVGNTKPHVIYGDAGADSILGSAGTDAASKDTLYGDAGNDTITANNHGAVLYGGDGNDVINGGTGADKIYGDAGNDTIDGKGGGDVIEGGAGADYITAGIAADTVGDTVTGGIGNDVINLTADTAADIVDVIKFSAGDGQDIVTGLEAGEDKLQFVDVTTSNLTYSRNAAGNVSIGIKDTTDSVDIGTTAGAYNVVTSSGTGKVITNAADGSTLTYAADGLAYVGKNGATQTVATISNTGTQTFDLTDGKYYSIENFNNDANWFGGSVVRGTTGANVLSASTKVVDGTTGDQLWGRAGNDILNGGNGNDVFWYGLNEGNDTINNASKNDVIRLYNVNSADVSYVLAANGVDLEIRFANSADRLTVIGWNTDATTRAKVQTADKAAFTPVVTANGTITTETSTGKTTIDLTSYTNVNRIDNTANLTGASVLRGASSNDTLQASKYGDQLWGRTGTDSLAGGTVPGGVDTFWYGRGEGDKAIANCNAEDIIKLYNVNLADTNFDVSAGGDLLLSFVGGDRVTVEGKTAAKILSADKTTPVNVAAVGAGNVNFADNTLHVGSTGATNDKVTVAAQPTTNVFDLTDASVFRSIEQLDAGAAAATSVVRGTAGNNSLTAAVLGSQLWGRAGNDILNGAAAGGADVFWYGKGEGADTIIGLEVDGTDKLRFYNANMSELTFADSGANVTVAVAGQTDVVTLSTIQLDDGVKYASVYTADNAVTPVKVAVANTTDNGITGAVIFKDTLRDAYYYGATATSTDTLNTTIAAGGVATAADLSSSKMIGIENIDNSTGAKVGFVLRGSAGDNVLTASAVAGTTNQLWGRDGNDTLVGADGATQVFWYGKNEGNDVITNFKQATDNDSIMLYTGGLTASDVAVSVNASNDVIFTIGSNTLTVKGAKTQMVGVDAGVVQFSDGSNYKVVYANSTYSLEKK